MKNTQAAIYARYSSEMQREASIEDQSRNCIKLAKREGFIVSATYGDQGISGSVPLRLRKGGQQLLADAAAKKWQVLIIDDLSRLSRDQVDCEQTIRNLEFNGIRILTVSDGYDSQSKSSKVQRGVRGLVNELFLDDLKEKTHRGMVGQALKGNNAGGKCYGYKHIPIEDSSRKDEYGRPVVVAVTREINEEQAQVIRDIFELYANGLSPLKITHKLNELTVPSPKGGTWDRTSIWGDPRSGIGILNNPLYIGKYIWNRSQWVKDPNTGKRKRFERPESEWIVNDMPELRIVDQDLWDRVHKRMDRIQTQSTGIQEAAASRKSNAGAAPRHLLSGILNCGECGANYLMVGKDVYGCSAHQNRGPHVCSNKIKVKKDLVEKKILEGIKQDLFNDEMLELFIAEVKNQLKQQSTSGNEDKSHIDKKLKTIDGEIQNVISAIRSIGISTALTDTLKDLEKEKQTLENKLKEKSSVAQLPALLPKLKDKYDEMVMDLEKTLQKDIRSARERMIDLLGEKITLNPAPEGHYLVADVGINPSALLSDEKSLTNQDHIIVVAGTGFEPMTFGL